MRVLVAAACIAIGCHGWTARDSAFELAAQASLAADYHQTQDCVDVGMPRCRESNPLIGARGERIAPATYFVGAGLLHVAIAAVLPHGWLRSAFQGATVAIEAAQVYRNIGQLDIAHSSSVRASP